MTQEFPQYMNVKGGIEVATFEQAVQQAVGKDPVVNAFLDLPHGTDTSFSEKLKGFVSAIEKTPEEKLSIAGRFIKFTFGLKGDLDNENGTDPQPDGSDNGTLGWLREQYDLLKGFNEELIGRPLQNLIFSKKDKNGNNVIVGTYGLVKTDRGAEEKFAGGAPDAILAYYQVGRDFRHQGYESVLVKHAIAYTLDAANDQKLAAEYADGKKLFRVGLFTNARRQKLYNRLGVVFEKPLGGDGLFSDEILGVAAIRPGMTLQNVMANTRQVVRQISKEVLAPPA